MKYLFYGLMVLAIYLLFCALNDLMHLRPFSALFETALAGVAGYLAVKYKPD